MKQSSYRDRDYAFGQAILTLRTAIGLTQAGLADFLGVSRRAVGEWEAGGSYPKADHLKQFIALAVKREVFPAGREAEAIRSLWQAARQKVLLNEDWLATLLAPRPDDATGRIASTSPYRGEQIRDNRSVRTGLPFQPTPFIGRVAELTEIARLLADPACRLLTLLGPGGVGKTRLVLQVAASQGETFAARVVFVPLGSVDSPNQIDSAIADSLDLIFSGQLSPREHLLDYLREQHLLLILDSFEHLLDGADLVYDILRDAPNVTILVTSQVRLNLQAEWLFDVEGLSYPSTDSPVASQNLADYSAVQLFAQRVAQVQSGLSLPESVLPTVVRICQHVAGIPLAIELAAASAPEMSIAEIERQIRSSLDVLATTFRDVPVRHRSLRAAFDHSWNLLSASERASFSRLAVFRGGCTAEAAEQVTGATFQVLMTLVDKSLLRHIAAGPSSVTDRAAASAVVEPRFVLLEPLREYALEKLAARNEAEALQRAHATYYLALAGSIAAQWDSPTAAAAIGQLDREYDNIRAVLQWACDGGDRALGFQLSGALRKFWQRRGYYSEGRAWLEDLLAVEDYNPDRAALTARLRGVDTAAWLASDQHDYARARQLFEQDTALRKLLGETEGWSQVLSHAGREARAAGQYQQATALFEDALARHRALGDRGSASTGGLGNSLFELALVHREQGHFARAADLFEECLQLHRELGDREGIAQALLGLGDIARDQGAAAGARQYSEQSLAISRDLGMQWAIGFSLNNLALVHYLERDWTGASTLVRESEALFVSLDGDGSRAEVLITKGHILRAQGDLTAAREAVTEGLRLAWVVGPRLMVAAALEGLACVIAEAAQAAEAVRFLGAASALRAQMVTPMRPADRPAVDHALAVARSILGADGFAAVWSEALEQPLEQIVSIITGTSPISTSASVPHPQATQESRSVEETRGTAPAPTARRPRLDWDDALAVPTFYGRQWELDLLTGWIVEERCRVVSVLGLGGIGKSALTVRLMHQVASNFEVVIWRSLRDIPTCEVLLDDLLHVLAPQAPGEIATPFERRLSILLDHLRSTRVLLVLDNLESVLDEGEETGRMRPGHEGFGRFLHQSAETDHQSCLLLTSREKPGDLVPLEGSRSPVRVLRLAQLDGAACEQLLAEKDVTGTAAERARLIEVYAGNPLALKIVAQTIVDLFDGEIPLFLEQGEVVFGGIRELFAEQFVRLSALEQFVLLWLAILREPSTLDELLTVLVSPVPRARLLEAVEALRRRSLIERGQKRGSFTLRSVVLEYATARLIAEAIEEIQTGKLSRLLEHGLELAEAREYVRQNQERVIIAPILEHLRSAYPQQGSVEAQLLALLGDMTSWPDYTQGYGPANVVALLRLLRGNLRGLDLSRLVLRSVYLQGVEMQDASLFEAMIQDSTFTETFEAMTAVAISSSGEYWAAASRRGEVRIWDDRGQTLHRAWRAHPDMVWTLAFSPDGRALASGSWDSTIKVWDVASGALLWSSRHTSQVNSVAFAPDGSTLASSGHDATVRLWDMRNGAQLQTLAHPGPVMAVTWSPDGRHIATGDIEGYIRLWMVNKSEPANCVQTLVGHTNWVDGLAFAPDGNMLASASWDSTVKLWEVPSGHLRETLVGHTDRVRRVVWSPDGRVIASAGFEQIWLWAVEQGSYRAALRGLSAGADGLAFTPDSRGLLSGIEDGTLRLWDVASSQCVRIIQGYISSLYSVDWSPDGTRLVSGGTDGLITIYDVASGTPPRVLHGRTGIVFAVGWSSDGQWLASSEWDNIIRLWDTTSGACLRVLHHPDDNGNCYGLTWSPDGQRLASGTYRHGVQVFDLTARSEGWIGHRFPTWVRHVAWSPDGTQLAGGGQDAIVYVWDADNGTLIQQLVGHHSMITSLAWSPKGARLASGSRGKEGGELFVWDVKRGEHLYTLAGHPGIVYAIAWGPSEDLLISGGDDGLLRWWDVQRGECVQIREAHQGTVRSLRRSPDGTRVVSCGDDGTIRLWDLDPGEYLQTLRRDRPYERLNITGIRGLTEAQKSTLRALGATEDD